MQHSCWRKKICNWNEAEWKVGEIRVLYIYLIISRNLTFPYCNGPTLTQNWWMDGGWFGTSRFLNSVEKLLDGFRRVFFQSFFGKFCPWSRDFVKKKCVVKKSIKKKQMYASFIMLVLLLLCLIKFIKFRLVDWQESQHDTSKSQLAVFFSFRSDCGGGPDLVLIFALVKILLCIFALMKILRIFFGNSKKRFDSGFSFFFSAKIFLLKL